MVKRPAKRRGVRGRARPAKAAATPRRKRKVKAAAKPKLKPKRILKIKLKPKPKPKPVTTPKRKRGGVVSVPKTYSTELLANGRHRFEQTDEPVPAIAADFRIHPGSLRRLAQRLGWVRFGMAPKQLPVTARLLEQAGELAVTHADAPASLDVETIARIERQVLQEIADIEAARAQLRGQPRPMREAESTARALTTLTDTLQKLQRLRLPLAAAGQERSVADDLPENIDEFRNELARRIRAFVASRSGTDDADGNDSAAAMDAAGG